MTRYANPPIYEALVGSHAYGLAVPGSDKDYIRIVVPAPSEVLGPEKRDRGKQTTSDEQDETTYSLRHFVGLCAKANPNTPVITESPEPHGNAAVRKLGEYARSVKLVKATLAYARGQAERYLKDIEAGPASRHPLIAETGFDTKAAYHVARLIGQASAISLVRPVLPLEPDLLEFCRRIRAGEVTVDEWIDHLRHFELYENIIMQDAILNLPQEPDYDAIAAASVQLHRAAWRW